MTKKAIATLLMLVSIVSFSQKKADNNNPKLVIGIVVDQMRYDYLERFASKYSETGFKRLMSEGYNLKNTNYNYVPTFTAVGHTSIYTGTTPSMHGIISNYWYDKELKKSIYCVDDSNYNGVGTTSKAGKKSPKRLYTTTIADQLKMFQMGKGKTIGVAIKDRSSILPAGHSATAAYWFEGGDAGNWITSDYYSEKLPKWVKKYNKKKYSDEFLNSQWNTLYDINTYTESLIDENDFENHFKGEGNSSFPHDLKELRKTNGNYSLIKKTPFGNNITADFAKAIIKNEKLGKGEYTDMLTLSFSSPDYVGHQFGVDSKEVEDTYIRLDLVLSDFFKYLDTQVGKGNYTLFLTADHAAIPVPSYMKTLKIPSGYFEGDDILAELNKAILSKYNEEDLIENISNFQVFFNHDKINEKNIDLNDFSNFIVREIMKVEIVYKAVTALDMQTTTYSKDILNLLQNGYNQKFSGDVLFVPSPAYIEYSEKGSTHGSGFAYDTHVPLLFMGKGIKQGESKKPYVITDIAPTISSLLGINQPNGTNGDIIIEVLK
ncbi:MAG: alkaline phosphatase family protein [Flavobacteriaceae bacterium]|nr:alkaline phosphatase family protein [Flavobacteriaceae bacterium]